jgi:hypothetical protein
MCECKKKFKKKVAGIEPITLCLLVHCSTIFTVTSLTMLKQIFILKVNHAQFKQTTPKCGWQEGNLGPLDIKPSTLPLEPC